MLVLEKSSRIGGRAAVVKKDGYTLDYGIHLVRFGPHSALAETCRRLGREIEFIPLGTSYVQDEDGVVKVFPTGPKDFLTSRLFYFPRTPEDYCYDLAHPACRYEQFA